MPITKQAGSTKAGRGQAGTRRQGRQAGRQARESKENTAAIPQCNSVTQTLVGLVCMMHMHLMVGCGTAKKACNAGSMHADNVPAADD
jgi:hypothetical protein